MYKILTDSCCDVPYELLKELDVDFISMYVDLDGEILKDDGGETFDTDRFYQKLKSGAIPTTSQVNIGQYVKFFQTYVDQQIPVLYICFSSGLSGSYQSAMQAVEIIKEDHPDAEIHVFDSKAASAGEGLMVYEAAQRKAAGATLVEQMAWLTENVLTYQMWFTVDDLNHLQRGGRISKTSAALGGLMNVKPVMNVDTNGKLRAYEKVRGRKKALHMVAEKIIETTADPAEATIFVVASGDFESAERVKTQIEEAIQPKEIKVLPMGPTIASHTGYGAVAAFSRGTIRK